MLQQLKNIIFGDQKGQDKLGYEYAIEPLRTFCHLVGIWPKSKKLKESVTRFYVPTPILISAMMGQFVIPLLCGLFLVVHEFPLVVSNLMGSAPAFTSCIYMMIMWYQKTEIKPVIESLHNDWQKSREKWEQIIMLKYARYSKFLTVASMASLSGSAILYNVAAPFGYNIRLYTNITDVYDRTLNLQAYYIYDYSKTPIFEITYLSQAFFACMMVYVFSLIISYFSSLIFHLTGQFEILAIKFEQFIELNLVAERKKQEFSKSLGELVTKHNSLIRSLKRIEVYFNSVMFIQLLTTYTGVCCGTLMMVYDFTSNKKNVKWINDVAMAGTFISALVCLFVLYMACETLIQKSLRISEKLYNSKWYLLYHKKYFDLIPVMIVSKIPLKLTVGGLMTISLESYTGIIKNIFRFLSLLVAVVIKKE